MPEIITAKAYWFIDNEYQGMTEVRLEKNGDGVFVNGQKAEMSLFFGSIKLRFVFKMLGNINVFDLFDMTSDCDLPIKEIYKRLS